MRVYGNGRFLTTRKGMLYFPEYTSAMLWLTVYAWSAPGTSFFSSHSQILRVRGLSLNSGTSVKNS